jgi:phage terminase large subunit-like protein
VENLPHDWKSWPDEKKRQLLRRLKYDWALYARPDQLPPPGDWEVWMLMAGRGFGKTRTAMEWVRRQANAFPGCRIHVVGQTYGSARDVCIEGESGLINITPRDELRAQHPYNKSRGVVYFANGSEVWTFSGKDPEKLRGPQCHFLVFDELAWYQYDRETWDMASFGLRLGKHPQILVATTPRPTELIVELDERNSSGDPTVVVTRGTTYDNAANLPASRLRAFEEMYGGTSLGEQELGGAILREVDGALWTYETINQHRIRALPTMSNIIVSVDPAVSNKKSSAETGIIVVGRAAGTPHTYVLEDNSLRGKPTDWARQAINARKRWHASAIIVEDNQGGEMCRSTIQSLDASVNVRLVHASVSKGLRARPVSVLYEKGLVHHYGNLAKLESQMTTWDPDKSKVSPDRLDALVHGITNLVSSGRKAKVLLPQR